MDRRREHLTDTLAVETPTERYQVSTDGTDREYDEQKGYPPVCPTCKTRLDTPILPENGQRIQEFCPVCEKVRHIMIYKVPRLVLTL